MFAGRRKLLPPKVTKLGRAERTRGSPQHRRMVLFYQMNPRACSLSSGDCSKAQIGEMHSQHATYLLMFQLSHLSTRICPPPPAPFSRPIPLLFSLFSVAILHFQPLNGKCLCAAQLGLVHFDDWN